MTTKSLATNFLNKELRERAQQRGATVLPEQATVNMAEVSKVKVKHATSRRP